MAGPVDHRSSPRLLASATGQDSAWFLPNGDLVLRSIEGSQNFLYRTSSDGTRRQKVIADPILDLISISPDGRWVVAAIKDSNDEHSAVMAAYPLGGGPAVRVCRSYCGASWDVTGKFFYLSSNNVGGGETASCCRLTRPAAFRISPPRFRRRRRYKEGKRGDRNSARD